jgi:hypothetical protein
VVGALWLVGRESSARDVLVAAVSLGIAILCRPIALFLPLALLPVFIWRSCGRPWRSSYALLNGVCALLVAAWVVRNALATGSATFSSIGAVNLFFHRAAAVQAQIEGRDVDAVRSEWEHQFEATPASDGEQARLRELAGQGLAIIWRHPSVYLIAYVRGLGRMAAPDHDVLGVLLTGAADSSLSRWLTRLSLVDLLVLYATAVAALWSAFMRGRSSAALVVPLTFVAYFVVTAGPEVYPRFRVPIMPFVVILSGLGFGGLVATVRR